MVPFKIFCIIANRALYIKDNSTEKNFILSEPIFKRICFLCEIILTNNFFKLSQAVLLHTVFKKLKKNLYLVY